MAEGMPPTIAGRNDIGIGEVVILKGEKIIGVVSYIGAMIGEDPKKQYVGLTLSDPVAQGHNGTEQGHRYFQCKDKHGIIIGPHLVARRISPPELLQKVTSLNNAFNQCFNQSQQMKQKLARLTETLSRVEGENQELRDKIRYYEQQLQYHAPFIEHLGDCTTPNHNISESPSASPSLSISPEPPNRLRSQSHQIQSRANMKRRTFNKPLPPLPPRKQNTTKQSAQQNRVVARYKKKSYEKRRQYYEQRSNSRKSFKSRRNRNRSDTSKSTLTSAAFTMTSTADLGSTSESPVPLSIGDDARTFKLLAPNLAKTSTSKSIGCDESESHDVGDNVSFDGNELLDDGLFPIKSTPRYTNHSTAARFNIARDDDDKSHTLYNEENDLDIGSILSYTSTKNIELKAPRVIHESPDNDEMLADLPDLYTNALHPHNSFEYEASPSLEYEEEEEEEAYANGKTYQQLDEDSNLEIESPHPAITKPDISIKVYKPQMAQVNNSNNNRIIVTPEPEIIVHDGVQTNSTHSNGSKLKLTAHASNTASSIPDNVGLYSTEPENMSGTLISDSPSNTPSYTQQVNTSTTTITTISPHKTLKRKKKRIIKRHSLTPQQMPAHTKFNPQRISKSQVRLSDISDDGDNTFAQEILYSMSSDDNLSNHSKKQRHNNGTLKITKRKSMGMPPGKLKKLKKRMTRSRTFVRNGDQEYDHDADHVHFEEEKSPQPLGIALPATHERHRVIVGSKTPQTLPLRAIKANEAPHPMTLDDFALDSPLRDHRVRYNQHNIQNSQPQLDVHHVHHQQYHSSHIPLAAAHDRQNKRSVPKHSPSLTTNLSQPNPANNFKRTRRQKANKMAMQRTKSSPGRPLRNLGSLTDKELKGFFTSDNLFIK